MEKLNYLVEITDPHKHIVSVKIKLSNLLTKKDLTFFLPSWSPGSYLMREYSRHVRALQVTEKSGKKVFFEQISKNEWKIDFAHKENSRNYKELEISYEYYAHDLTVRTSWVDVRHAFLHGPSYLMGIKEREDLAHEIEFKFPLLWSKIHTALTEIGENRDEFIFLAENYDQLLDCPVEIGCHESDGFMHDGKEHHVAFFGETFPHPYDLKKDMEMIVKTVSSHFSSIPYEKYIFITHFVRERFGGLEHKNSTALQFDGRKLHKRSQYLQWLALVAHEYFHTWNVKRIRPAELGPFDYLAENYTKMHWLTEGLTSFMDELFVLRSGLCTLEEYLEMQTGNLNKYFMIPGKKFHSLEESSFNAWIKLYRPDEFSNHSSISYYLKGGLVFSTLFFDLKREGIDIKEFLELLWQRYLKNPEKGMSDSEVYDFIEQLAGKEIRESFEYRIQGVEEIDFETYYNSIGLSFEWEKEQKVDLGTTWSFKGDRVLVSSVDLDGAAYRAGLNAQDEIIAINDQRFLKGDTKDLTLLFLKDKQYKITVCREGRLHNVDIIPQSERRKLKEIKVIDKEKALKAFISP